MNSTPKFRAGLVSIARILAASATLLGLGCSSFPTIVPDMAPVSNRPVQLQGARGPLTAQQSKAILAQLESRGQETNIFDRHLAIEEGVTDSPLVVGNRVLLLKDGPATYQAMYQAIRAARNRIYMETYIIEDDEVGRKFADELLQMQAKGVRVALAYDSVGSINTPKEFFTRLTDGGIKVLEFNPVNPLTAKAGWDVNQRDHRKQLIVDGQVAFVGGINISSVYSGGSFSQSSKRRPDGGPPWRDTHLQIDGPVVADFEKLFLSSWTKQKGEPLTTPAMTPVMASAQRPMPKGKEIVRAIGSSPDDPSSPIYATFLSAIRSAETSVHITVAYFAPDPQLLGAIKDAAQRGVDVKLILPSNTDSWLIFNAGRSHYTDTLRSGVKIYERRDALLHAKTAVIDGVWSTIGSTNLDWRSFLHNDEVNAVILGPEFGAQMEAMFQADLGRSDLITMEGWKQRSVDHRVKELAARMWEYWL